MKYRKQKPVPFLYRHDGMVKIEKDHLPEGDFVITDGTSEYDFEEKTSYILLDTQGHEVEKLFISYEKIPEPEKEQFNYTPIENALKQVEDAIYTLDTEVDLTEVTHAIRSVKSTLEAIEYPKPIDYSQTLERLLQATTERVDLNEVTALLDELVNVISVRPVFEIPENLISDNRIKVEVDRIGAGGGGSSQAVVEAVNDKLLKATYDGTNSDLVRIDASTNTLQTITYEHHEIHSGSHYFVGGYQDLSINNVLQFTWQMPNTTAWTHWVWKINTESETLWQVYEGGTITNALANAITPVNSNRNSSNTSGTTMRYELHADLTNANGDVDVSGATLIDSGISGAGKESGNETRQDEIILKQNTLYVFRATATAAGFVNFHMTWYEHTNKH